MDDEQGRSLISFPYPAGVAEGTDAGTAIEKRDMLLGCPAGAGRGVPTNGRPTNKHMNMYM